MAAIFQFVSPDKLKYLRIEVDVQASRLGVLDDQRRREPAPGSFDGLAPRFVPHVLERDQCASDLRCWETIAENRCLPDCTLRGKQYQ